MDKIAMAVCLFTDKTNRTLQERNVRGCNEVGYTERGLIIWGRNVRGRNI
jgi:hypothetical protein